jgi:membrane protease YdiL (CAAX protease family)
MALPWASALSYALGLGLACALVRTGRLRQREPGIALRQRLGVFLTAVPLFLLLGVGLRSLPALAEGAVVAPAPTAQLAEKALVHGSVYLAVPSIGIALVLGRQGLVRAAREHLGNRGPGGLARALKAGIVCSATLALLVMVTSTVMPDAGGLLSVEGAELFFSEVSPGVALGLAAAAAGAEELLFRGVMLDTLRRHLPAGVAVGIQAVAFGLIHAGYGSLVHVVGAGAFAAIVGALAVRHGLAPAVLTHFVVNLVILAYWSGHYELLLPVAASLASAGVLAAIVSGDADASSRSSLTWGSNL